MTAVVTKTFTPGFRTIDGGDLNSAFGQVNDALAGTTPAVYTGTFNGVVGGTTPAAATVTDFTTNGVVTETAQTLAAAGATQGTATLITKSVVIVTVTASTEGVKLPASPTGKRVAVLADPAVGVKVYPNAGCQIEGIATNTAQALVKAKANIYYGVSATKWRAVVGA